ncbi:PREDICTED: derlin-3 isoform 2 [Odobenus rosmarus divergens]|uniref:Derlin-3 isoform 2 n=1 Tax=Odobenus rosmarus divergens TaxID=9708 RepID=A0A9B0LQ54_ODORO
MAWQGLTAEFLQVPAVTRAYTAACVLTTAAVVSWPGGWGRLHGCSPGGVSSWLPLYSRGLHLTRPWFRSNWSSSAPSSSISTRTSCSGSSRSGGSSPTSSSSGPWDSASSSTCSSSAGAPGQSVLLGPGPHSHAGVCMEPPQPPSEGQLLRPPHLPGTIPALGTHGVLSAAGQLDSRGPAGDCCGPHLLLPRGCLPQPARRQEAAADPQLPEAATGCPTGGP